MTRTFPWAGPGLGLGCTLVLVLVLACFWPVLFRDGQFAHFDAAFFYYPLYLRVQQEWDAGRWPLWEPEENGGSKPRAWSKARPDCCCRGWVNCPVSPYDWRSSLRI